MRTACSTFLIILLIPATLLLFLVLSLRMNVLTPEFLKHELSARGAYVIALHQIDSALMNVQLDAHLPLTNTDLENLTKRVVTPLWLQGSVEGVIDHSFAWLKSPLDIPLSLPIDLHEPKTALFSGIDTLIEEKIKNLPECSKSGQSAQLCKTPGLTPAHLKEMIKSGGIDLVKIKSQFPETFDLANPVLPVIAFGDTTAKEIAANQAALTQQVTEITGRANEAKTHYHDFLRYALFALAVYALIVLCYALLNSSSWYRFLQSTGILFTTIGILPTIVGALSTQIMERVLLPNLNLDPNLPSDVQNVIPLFIRDIEHALFSPILLTGILLLVVGFILIVSAHFVAKSLPQK